MLSADVIAHLRSLPRRIDGHRPELLPIWAWKSEWSSAGVWQDVLTDAGRDVLAQVGRAEKAEAALAAVQARLTDLQSRPWGLVDTLLRLADGADHLLDVHSCDAHGYETLGMARDSAREMALLLAALLKGDL